MTFIFERHRPESYPHLATFTINDYLNTLSDYGIIGFTLLFGLAAYIFWCGWMKWQKLPFLRLPKGALEKVTSTSKLFLGSLLLGLLAFSIHLFVEFHLKIPALFFIVAIFFGLIAKLSSTDRWTVPVGKRGAVVAMFIILFFGIYFGWERTKSLISAQYYDFGREQFSQILSDFDTMVRDEVYLKETIRNFEKSTQWNPGNAYAWSALGFTILQTYYLDQNNHEAIGLEAEEKIKKR